MRLLGRVSEMAACRDAVLGGNGPSGVVIQGVPGIGKTVLHRTMITLAANTGWRILSTTGLRGQAALPLANLADLLDPYVRDVLGELPAVQAEALSGALRLAEAAEEPEPSLIARAMVGALRALAGTRLLVAIDDEQWLDEDTRRLLKMAATWLTDCPVTWLVSERPEHTTGLSATLEHEMSQNFTRLSLGRLDTDTLVTLVIERFPGRWSPRLAQEIAKLAAGNPYTALELARETIAVAGHGATATHVPPGLAQSLAARLHRLPDSVLTVVRTVALSPRPTRALLRAASLAGLPADGVDSAVDHALESEILDSTPPDPVLRFSHPLLRELAETSMSSPLRRRLHRYLAVATADRDESAGHVAAGAEEPDEKQAALVAEAAERIRAQGAPARAAALAEAAVALTPDGSGDDAWRRRLLLFGCLDAADEWDRCRGLLELWHSEIPDKWRGELLVRRGEFAVDLEEMISLQMEGIRELAPHSPGRAADVAIYVSRLIGVNMFQLDRGKALSAEAVHMAQRDGDAVLLRTALGNDACLAYFAGAADAGQRLKEAVALPSLADMPDPYRSPEVFLGWWYMSRGEVAPARELLLAALAQAERRGLGNSAAGMMLHLTELEWRAGQWETARRYAAEVDRFHREVHNTQPGVPAYVVSLVAASQGRAEEARAAAVEGVRLSEENKDLVFAAQCRFVLGQLELSLDAAAAAVSWLEPLAGLFLEQGFVEPGMFPFPPDLVEAYARVGRISDATNQLARLRHAAEVLDHGWARITAGRAEAVLLMAQRDPQAALGAASAAVAEGRDHCLPLELGRCLLVLGTVQRRARQRREAARTLDEAIALFEQLGASCWAALARDQRARLAHASEDVLTPAEQRVAGLVGEGLTNAEISAALLISVKTVEANLTRIYRKLGIRSRVDLARRFQK